MMNKAFVRTADLSDISGIWSLCSTYFDEYRGSSLEDFQNLCFYRWRDNPARTDAHPFGWVLENEERQIVGFLGLVPMRVQVGARVVTAASGTSWVVDTAYRSYGLDLYKKYMSWGDRYLLLDTTAGPIASQFHQRLKMGMQPIPHDDFHQKLVWVLNPGRYLQQKIKSIILKPREAVAKVIRPVAEAERAWSEARSAEGARPSASANSSLGNLIACPNDFRQQSPESSDLYIEEIFAFQEEFDSFWNDVRKTLGVTVVRDRSYLTWRFLKKPKLSGHSFVFTCRDKKGDLLGYLVLQQGGYMNRPADTYVLTEIVFRKSKWEEISPPLFQLFLKALSFVKEKKGTVLEVSNFHPHLMTELKRFRPRVEQIPHQTYWFKASSEELKAELREKPWWTSNADGDLNL